MLLAFIFGIVSVLLLPLKITLNALLVTLEQTSKRGLTKLEQLTLGEEEQAVVSKARQQAFNMTKKTVETTAKAGVATVKGAAKAGKTTVKLGKTAVKASVKAIKLAIKAIKLLIALIKAVISVLAFIAGLGIVGVIIVIVAVIAAAGACVLYVMDGSGNFNFANTGSGVVASNENDEDGGTTDEEEAKKWLAHIEKVYKIMLDSGTTYSQTNKVTIKIDGKEYGWRPDCSGTISTMLWSYGEVDGIQSTDTIQTCALKTFKRLKIGSDIKEPDELKAGDVFNASDGHIRVITSYDTSTHTAKGYHMGQSGEKVSEWSGVIKKWSNGTFQIGSNGKHYDMVIRPVGKASTKKSKSGGKAGDWVIYFQGGCAVDGAIAWGKGNGSETYATGSFQGSGCGITCVAMVAATYSGNQSKYTPLTCKDIEFSNNKGTKGTNKNAEVIPNFFNKWTKDIGLKCSNAIYKQLDFDEVDKCISAGGCLIVDFNENPKWTQGTGHYVIIRSGNQKDGYRVLDPNNGHASSGSQGDRSLAPYNNYTFDPKEHMKGNVSYYYTLYPNK